MQVLFINEVLGLSKLHYYLKRENPQKHDEYLKELLEYGYLEDVSEVFIEEEDKKFARNAFGFLEIENKFYVMPNSSDELSKKLRTERKGIEIIEKYNKLLKEPMNLQYKQIEQNQLEKMTVVEWEDGSESVVVQN